MGRYLLRYGLCAGLVVGLAGCSGVMSGAPQQSLAPGSSSLRTMSGSYPTSQTLIFEGAYNSGTNPWLINIYEAGKIAKNPSPIATITDSLDDPYSLAMDSSGTLYVANLLNSTVTEYPRGQTTHSVTITDGVYYPGGVAVDSTGTLYVSNYQEPSGGNTGFVSEYSPGSTTPSTTITGFNGILTEEALDKHDNLYLTFYVSGSGSPSQIDVVEVPKGTTKIEHLNLKDLVKTIDDIGFDKSGRLWLTQGIEPYILIYKLPGTKPVAKIRNKLMPTPYWISTDKSGVVFVDSSGNSKVGPNVDAFKPGATKPFATLTNSVYYPYGLLVAKP